MPELRAEERFEDFLRRTSDYQYLKANKLRREREVDASRTGGGLLGSAHIPSIHVHASHRVTCIELQGDCTYLCICRERFHSTEVSGLNISVSVTTLCVHTVCVWCGVCVVWCGVVRCGVVW